jgi:hypothetical protein
MPFHIAWFQIFIAALQAFLAQAGTTIHGAVSQARATADEGMSHLHPDLIANPEFDRHGKLVPPGSRIPDEPKDTPQPAADATKLEPIGETGAHPMATRDPTDTEL